MAPVLFNTDGAITEMTDRTVWLARRDRLTSNVGVAHNPVSLRARARHRARSKKTAIFALAKSGAIGFSPRPVSSSGLHASINTAERRFNAPVLHGISFLALDVMIG